MDSIEHIVEALNFIPSDDREIWLRIGMAIKSELGQNGFEIWDSWSQSSVSYNQNDSKSVWKSIKSDGGITIGSLFHTARGHGYSFQEEYLHSQSVELKNIHSNNTSNETLVVTKDANDIWHIAEEADLHHPYLLKKGIDIVSNIKQLPYHIAATKLGYPLRSKGVMLSGDLLVIPIIENKKIISLQFIDPVGTKFFPRGSGTLKSGYWTNKQLPDNNLYDGTLLIGEGVATVLSASSASCHIGIASFSSSRLSTVSKQIRKEYPKAKLIILADLKQGAEVPIQAAVKAANDVGGFIAIPYFNQTNDNLTDFNDMFLIEGAEAVKNSIEQAKKIYSENQNKSLPTVNTICAMDIEPKNISWLWNGWLAEGKFHILVGAPGTGKTSISIVIASIISNGGYWPDGTIAPEGDTLIWSGEDDPSDTIVPRLSKSNANLSRVHFITEITYNGKQRSFDPATDIELLKRKVEEIGTVKLLIIDPIVSAIQGDSHKNAEVRRSLQPLADLAAQYGIAIIGITHFTKGTGGSDPIERITGSLAFGALARIVLVSAKSQSKNEDGHTSHIFIRAKSNIGSDEDGFEYNLQQGTLKDNPNVTTSFVTWGEQIKGTAKELLSNIESNTKSNKLKVAIDFLTELLTDEPVPQSLIEKECKIENISWATIRRAKNKLGVKSYKNGSENWMWVLNTEQDAQNN